MTARFAALAILAGCGSKQLVDPPTCDGGGTPAIGAGAGGKDAFAPWSPGDAVPITQQGGYGFRVELESTGLDTTSSIVTFVRYTLGDATATEDAGGTLTFVCTDQGTGWTEVFVTLDDEYQTPDAVAGLDGEALHMTVLATDQANDEADQDLDLALQSP